MSDKRLMRDKADTRRRMAAMRDEIDAALRATKAAEIADALIPLLEGRRLVMVFRSFRSEVPTPPIAERLVAEGHDLALPLIEPSTEGPADLVPVAWNPGEQLVRGTFGIDVPADRRPLEPRDLDAVLIPGLAFDRAGYRVGYGGGFYDRLLPRLRDDAARIAIGFAEQLLDEVPHGTIDVPVDLLVTDEGVQRFGTRFD